MSTACILFHAASRQRYSESTISSGTYDRQLTITLTSSYLGCPRCFSRQRNAGLYGSHIRDVCFNRFRATPLFSLS